MANSNLQYYILFANYEQGMALHDLLTQDGIPNRIAPTPRTIAGSLPCGMSLLIQQKYLEAAEQCIQTHDAAYHDIVAVEGQLQSHRDKYC